MNITFSPIRQNTPLTLSHSGDTITVNGEIFDFSPLPEGATLPREAIGSDWFAGPVERINGELHLSLLLPHGPKAPYQTLFPEPIMVFGQGSITLPPYGHLETE